MSAPTENQSTTLQPTEGIVDYANQYLQVVQEKEKIIDSAKYFMKIRRNHMLEVIRSYDDLIDNEMTYEEGAIILNEFLSPTCTLLQFEFINLTSGGKDELDGEKTPTNDSLNKTWQKQILGRVLTMDSDDVATIHIPANAQFMFNTKTTAEKDGEVGKETSGDAAEDNTLGKKKPMELFTVHKYIQYFVKNIDIDKLTMSRFLRNDIRRGIENYKKAFRTIEKAVKCLVYLEIVEALRDDPENCVAVIFSKTSKMIKDDKQNISTKESEALLTVAQLFIERYRSTEPPEHIYKAGYSYVGTKLQIMKTTNANDTNLFYIADILADDEATIFDSFDLLKTVFDFSTCKI